MVHLLMKFDEDLPVFTGLAFAKGTMASAVAEYRNKDKDGYHYVTEFPVDTSEDYDGRDDLADGGAKLFLVIVIENCEETIYSVHTDREAAELMVIGKTSLRPDLSYDIQEVKVHYGYPSDMGDAGDLAVL